MTFLKREYFLNLPMILDHVQLACIVRMCATVKANDSLTAILLFSLIVFVVAIGSKDLIFD